MNTQTIEAAARRYKQYKHMAEEANAEAEKARDELKRLLNGEPQTVYAGDYKISWTVFEQSRLDSAALKREMPGIYAMYQKPTTSDRLTVN